MQFVKVGLRWLIRAILLLVVIVGLYLAVAWFTAMVPRDARADAPAPGAERQVLLIQTLLHVDIAVPYEPSLLSRLPHLLQANLPIDNPNLKYVAFGWGSKAFYTSAGSYADIRPGAVFQAVTGDEAVMRTVAMGYLDPDAPDVATLSLSEEAYQVLLSAIGDSFGESRSSLPGLTIGPFDAFFEAEGHFHIFNPCNQWVNDVLHKAGVRTGRWTPTTYSLMRSLEELSPSNFQR